MKNIQLQICENGAELDEKTTKKIVEQIKKFIKTNEIEKLPTISNKASEKQLFSLCKTLEKIEGVERATRQTLSYPYGMGGMYGHGIEVKIDIKKMPTILWTGDGLSDGYLINVEHFLNQFSICENTQKILDGVFEGDVDNCIEYLSSINDELNYTSDNTYNHSSDLSSDLIIHAPTNWETLENFIVFISVHLGGDPRGNYESFRAYSMDYDSYTTLVTGIHGGFYNEQFEQYSSGYTREPQYSFFQDFEIIERDGHSIKAKNIKTGEIVDFTCDINF